MMVTLYDGNGNPIQVSGGASASDFGVTDYALFTNDNGETTRQAVLTYQGKKLYPKNFPEQRLDFVKDYGGGVMIALGDSYTAMGGSYFSAFAEKHGLVCDNRGMGSSTIAGSEDRITVGYHPFWCRMDDAIAEYQAGHTIDGETYYPEDVKLVTFMGGANDWQTVKDDINRLGEGTNETDKETLHGALNYIFSTLLSTFPNADIVVILQPSNAAREIPNDESTVKSVGFESLAQAQGMTNAQYSTYLMEQKERIVERMAKMYGLPVCDCCFEWYNPSNPDDLATYWADDELHMTAAGNEAIFAKLEKTVNNLPFTRN